LFAYGPAGATVSQKFKTLSALASLKSRLVLPFCTGLPKLSWKRGCYSGVVVVVVIVVGQVV